MYVHVTIYICTLTACVICYDMSKTLYKISNAS